MKELIINKKILLALLVALVIGGTLGWLVKPAANREETVMSAHDHADHPEEIWTCSMHPQIRQSEPGQCPICGMDLIPANAKGVSGNTNPMAHEMTPEAVAMANIHTSRVIDSQAEGVLALTGKVKADERQVASITAKFPGRIEQLFVNFTGQVVNVGQRLATIYSPDLVTAQKELLEAASIKATYPELYKAAREKLRLWKLSEKQIDEIENTGKVRDQFDVLADKRGVVSRRNIAVGDYVSTGSVLFDVVDLSRVWIMLDAYERDLNVVKVGDEVEFSAAGIAGESFTARVTFIDPVINPDTRAASVRAEVHNKGGKLRPEMFVNATLKTRFTKNGSSLVIPHTSLLWSGKRSVVYVKVPDAEFPTFEMREITIGPRLGDMYLVEAGLEANEEIVTNGVFAVDAAAQLAGKPSMMSKQGGVAMTGHHHGGMSGGQVGSAQDVPVMDHSSHQMGGLMKINEFNQTYESDPAFQSQLENVFKVYLPLKDALVRSDLEVARSEARKLQQAINTVDMKLVKKEAHMEWMKDLEVLKNSTQAIVDAGKLDQVRMSFSPLSDQLFHSLKKFQVSVAGYRQFCPMAMDNKGAYWLSDSEKILNPYFGDAMLTCGNVEEDLKQQLETNL